MNVLLIFFAIPVAVIILSAIFESFINCPIKIAGITFAIFLIVTFAFFDATFLIATIVYTILAFITAVIVRYIFRCNNRNSNTRLCNDLFNFINQNENSIRRIINNETNLNSVTNGNNCENLSFTNNLNNANLNQINDLNNNSSCSNNSYSNTNCCNRTRRRF